MDDESVRQPSWLPRYATETRKPAAPVSKVNAAHRECCHRPAPPDLSSSPPIVRLSHPLPPFFEMCGRKKVVKVSVWKNLKPAPHCQLQRAGHRLHFFLAIASLQEKKKILKILLR